MPLLPGLRRGSQRVALQITTGVLLSCVCVGPASASPKTVLELFTSQGCSSCPPADRLMQEYVNRDDVIALSLPVDYWDTLGWKDTLASPSNSNRQRAYAQARGDGQVYTPQTVIDGRAHAIGSSASAIDDAIASAVAAHAGDHVALRLSGGRDGLSIDIGAAKAPSVHSGKIILALVQKTANVAIGRGENRGRTVAYHNVVRSMKQIGSWSGAAARTTVARSALDIPGTQMAVVLLQAGDGGPIIGAETILLDPQS